MTNMAYMMDININRMVSAAEHGKGPVDSQNGIDKKERCSTSWGNAPLHDCDTYDRKSAKNYLNTRDQC